MEISKRPKGLYAGLAIGLMHLGIATAGCFWGDQFPSWLSLYGYYTGGVSNLKFFAPDIGSQLRLTFEGRDQYGLPHTGDLMTGRREADLRIQKIIAAFWKKQATDEFRRGLAASWAGKIFAQHPELQTLAIKLDVFELPPLPVYRAGTLPSWRPYYYATFHNEAE